MTLAYPFLDDNSVQPGDFAENDSTESEEEQCSTEDEEDGLPAGIEVPLVIIQRLRSLKDDCRRKQQKIRELKERVRQLEEQLRSKNGLRPPPVVSIHAIRSSAFLIFVSSFWCVFLSCIC